MSEQPLSNSHALSPFKSNAEKLNKLLDMTELVESLIEPIHEHYWQTFHHVNPAHQSRSSFNDSKFKLNSSDGSTPASSLQNPQASIWNRQGFTPIPQTPSQADLDHDLSGSDRQFEVDAQYETTETPVLSASQEIESVDRMYAEDLPSVDEQEAFVPLTERLMRTNQELSNEQDRALHDSSVPQALDELYDDFPSLSAPSASTLHLTNSSHQTPSVVVPLRITPPPFDPELHAIIAPAPLQTKTKTPWGKIILVSLISLIIGGAIAYGFLSELASFIN
jgi:hypothetical protein